MTSLGSLSDTISDSPAVYVVVAATVVLLAF